MSEAFSIADLQHARVALYSGPPREVAALEQRRQVMQPAGPLLYAEAESRLLHEQLSMIVLAVESSGLDLEAGWAVIAFLLRRSAARLGGWYSLVGAQAVVDGALAMVESADATARLECLRELSLYVGRLNYWLDLTIPWNDINELMRARTAEEGAA